VSQSRLSVAAALILFCVAVAAGYRSVGSVRRQLAVGRVCEAVGEQRWSDALDLSAVLDLGGPDGQIAAECRCWALLATGAESECVDLIGRVMSRPDADDWTLPPMLARVVVRVRRDRGELGAAAALARQATALHPTDRDLLQLELVSRSVIEGEEPVLQDLSSRLEESEGQGLSLRLVLSHAYHRRGDFERALDLRGDQPPPTSDPALPDWFEARARALASLRRLNDVVRTYDRWVALGGNPYEIRARYALRISQSGLSDPKRSAVELLRGALAAEPQIPSAAVREALYHRLVGHLLVADRPDEALEVYDRAREQYELRGLTRDQIVRSAELSGPAPEGEGGVLSFRLPPEAIGGSLLVSPAPDLPADRDFDELPVPASGEVVVSRSVDVLPQRWVARTKGGATIGSGTVWPVAGRRVDVAVEPRPPQSFPPYRADRPPGDGRRRVFVVLPDCADWRLVQYLRARGELPVLDHLVVSGHRAVLRSTPPLTAAAMESLVWPGRGQRVTFVGLAHRLGLELAGLASIGTNPLRFLSAVLPEAPNLFETIGSGPHVAANMLFAHAAIDAGHHAAIVGPEGERSSIPSLSALRLLTPEEKAEFPGLLRHPKFVPLVETIAAELDAAIDLAHAGEVDLLMLRLESLDILTHAHFHELTRSGQDDGDAALLWVYRYIDSRLARLYETLDTDDVLIVMSDHGIRTPMEHAEDAVFVAVGDAVPRGRASGMPHLRGTPRVIADLLGVESGWPETGIAEWASGAAKKDLHGGGGAGSSAGE
jgi:hypothetical protein